MRFLICYDITEDRRRDRAATALLDFGPRIQESVFFATLDDELYSRMVARLEKIIDPQDDTVHIFALCSACASKVRRFGKAEIPEDRSYYIV